MKPFLKWAGNKYQIVERIKEQLPPGKRLIEPFVGSGAVFVNTTYDAYLLADANGDLIQLYQHLQAEGDEFIAYAQQFFVAKTNTKEQFYHFRTEFNRTDDTRYKSALFVYMNKHCFNGLCRYNQKGEYNVPFGRYKKPYFPEKELRFFHQHAQNAEFSPRRLCHGDGRRGTGRCDSTVIHPMCPSRRRPILQATVPGALGWPNKKHWHDRQRLVRSVVFLLLSPIMILSL